MSMRSISFLASILASVAGCTLTLDPGRHMGGGGTDVGPRDVGVGVDAPRPIHRSFHAPRRGARPPGSSVPSGAPASRRGAP